MECLGRKLENICQYYAYRDLISTKSMEILKNYLKLSRQKLLKFELKFSPAAHCCKNSSLSIQLGKNV